jgi:hypothetical protein
MIASLIETEKRPDGKVVYGGARRGRENSLGLRDGKKLGLKKKKSERRIKEGHGHRRKRNQYRGKKDL